MSEPDKYPWTTDRQVKGFNEDGSVMGWVVDAGPVRELEDQVYSLKAKLYDVESDLQNTKGLLIQSNSWLEDAKAELARMKQDSQ